MTDRMRVLLQPQLLGREGAWGGITKDNCTFINAGFWILLISQKYRRHLDAQRVLSRWTRCACLLVKSCRLIVPAKMWWAVACPSESHEANP